MQITIHADDFLHNMARIMISTLLDELMGRALWINEPETFGVTTSMSITYRHPVPYGVKLKARGYITFNSKIVNY